MPDANGAGATLDERDSRPMKTSFQRNVRLPPPEANPDCTERPPEPDFHDASMTAAA